MLLIIICICLSFGHIGALGNATAELKQLLHEVAPSADGSGLAKIILKYSK